MAIYVVTGAAGFIGSHLTDALLARGHEVRALDDFSTGRRENLDPRCKVITADVADRSSVGDAMVGADGCFHLAAIASITRANAEWIATHRTNQTGTVTVLDAARAAGGIPVVYASSAAVYGDIGARLASEKIAPAPLTAYGADKLGSELHARVAHVVHRVPTLGLRFFNVYGPRQDPTSPYSGVISIFARAIARRGSIVIHGDGTQVRDFIHVTDVVAHLLGGMTALHARPRASVLNVCTGDGTRIRDVAALIADIAECAPDMRVAPPRVGDIVYSVGDPTMAIEMLAVEARINLRDGLAATMAALSVAERVAERPALEAIRPEFLRPDASRAPAGWLPRRLRAS